MQRESRKPSRRYRHQIPCRCHCGSDGVHRTINPGQRISCWTFRMATSIWSRTAEKLGSSIRDASISCANWRFDRSGVPRSGLSLQAIRAAILKSHSRRQGRLGWRLERAESVPLGQFVQNIGWFCQLPARSRFHRSYQTYARFHLGHSRRIFPGFMMFFGSSARLIVRMTSSSVLER